MESQILIAIILGGTSLLGTIISGLLQLRKWISESKSLDAKTEEVKAKAEELKMGSIEKVSSAWERLNIKATERLEELEVHIDKLENEIIELKEVKDSLKAELVALRKENERLTEENIILKERVTVLENILSKTRRKKE